MAHPAAVEDRGLEDDVIAAAHRFFSQRSLRLVRLVLVPGQVRDHATVLTKVVDVALLVRLAAPLEQLYLRILAAIRLVDQPSRRGALQPGQVSTLEEADQVRS